MLTALMPFFLVLVVLSIIGFIQRGTRAHPLRLRDVGTIIDRAITAYRQQLIPMLILAALCLPLGLGLRDSGQILLLILGSSMLDPATGLMLLPGILGIGPTLLAWGVAAAMRATQQGQPIRVGTLFPRQRLRGLLLLLIVMAVPAVLSTLLGWAGRLLALFWAITPAIMVYEGIGAWAATRRSFTIVRANFSALLNTVVPLWLIGWLAIGAPVFVGIGFLASSDRISDAVTNQLVMAGLLICQVCVAPLTEYGAVTYYTYIQALTTAPLDELEQAIREFDTPTPPTNQPFS